MMQGQIARCIHHNEIRVISQDTIGIVTVSILDHALVSGVGSGNNFNVAIQQNLGNNIAFIGQ